MINKIKVVALILIFILNIVDGAATLHWIDLGIAKELNPIMDHALSYSPILFIFIKTIFVGSCLFLLYRCRMHRLVSYIIGISFCVYLATFIIHARMFFDLYL